MSLRALMSLSGRSGSLVLMGNSLLDPPYHVHLWVLFSDMQVVKIVQARCVARKASARCNRGSST